MAVTHDLKTLPVYFDAVERGEKTFEIRRDDRGFQKGDTVRLLRLAEQPGVQAMFTSRNVGTTNEPDRAKSLRRGILWILTGGQFGLEPGYVILALGPVDEADPSARPAPLARGGKGWTRQLQGAPLRGQALILRIRPLRVLPLRVSILRAARLFVLLNSGINGLSNEGGYPLFANERDDARLRAGGQAYLCLFEVQRGAAHAPLSNRGRNFHQWPRISGDVY